MPSIQIYYISAFLILVILTPSSKHISFFTITPFNNKKKAGSITYNIQIKPLTAHLLLIHLQTKEKGKGETSFPLFDLIINLIGNKGMPYSHLGLRIQHPKIPVANQIINLDRNFTCLYLGRLALGREILRKHPLIIQSSQLSL